MAIFLGIDGGGTKTTCAIGDETNLLGSATSGGSNVVRVGEEHARASLQAAVLKACYAAGITPDKVERSCIGVAGGSNPEVREALRRLMQETVHGSVYVVSDMDIALEAAFGGGPGVVVSSGTGSHAFGRNERGVVARAGGWGYEVSDEGSGYWIGHAAVAAVLRAHDTGETTLLESLILDTWRLPTREAMVAKANSKPAPDFSELCPQVIAAANTDDTLAAGILVQAGVELSRLAAIVLRRLWTEEHPIRVAIAGGVFQNSTQVRKSFHNGLRAQRPDAVLSFATINPVAGALALARKGLSEFAAHP